ncbi:Myosin-IXa-like protein [Dinothrombium tinctorium]|uniref:Myosin-IXa-like protein n=1 Tax=Dinothrombium tinctorium TaxID=1965070 RepID=A0A443QZL3_9ACAR|nr:Myosin-IXa-like protein [Dinothrombium tinctorium]
MAGDRFVLQVYVGAFSRLYEALSIEASKQTTAEEILECIAEKLSLKEANSYELAEVIGNEGQDCKERRISPSECPVALQLLWPQKPKSSNHVIDNSNGPFRGPEYRFCLRRKFTQCMNWSFSWTDSNDSQLLKDYFLRFLYQPRDREYPDLCQLPDLTEQTLLENLKARFDKGHIYTYVGSILIAVNPFKFYPIYNPKYVQLYQNRRLGDLPPHIFAIADAAYQKSRIVSQAKNERNYHVFYYLLAGSAPSDKELLHLLKPSEYFYLNQSKCYTLEGVDEAYEFGRLKQSLEMVGFSTEKQKRLFAVLSAEEYKREGINWKSIDFHDNVACLSLIEGRPHGLLCLLDDQCNFPGATNETFLQKVVNQHKNSPLFEVPPCRQSAFVIKHYAGKVKYQIKDFREKNMDLMRPDIVSLLKSSSSAFVRELVGSDPLAIFRWQILKAFFKAYFVFTKLREQSKQRRGLNVVKTSSNPIKSTKRSGFELKKSYSCNNNALNPLHIAKQTQYSSVHQRVSNTVNKNSSCERTSNINTPQYIRGSLLRAASSPCPLHGLDAILCSTDAKVLQRASKILQKNKLNKIPSLRHKGIEKSIKNLQTLKSIVGKSNQIQPSNRTTRKQTPTVTAQFQQSLNQLMETLNQANPFFVRCIKSNAEKIPNHFNDMLVLVQLRYTGMLETVRIRQSGYSVRLSFDEFIQHYRILLPRGLLSSQSDIREFLLRMNLNRDNYQMGKTKIFMRESEKLALDDMLHKEILRRIVTLQRAVRSWITRQRFLRIRAASITIQTYVRRWLAYRRVAQLKLIATYQQWAATTIQSAWRAFRDRQEFLRLRRVVSNFQAHCRGFLCRKQFKEKLEKKRKISSVVSTNNQSSNFNVDNQSSQSDEAFLSKGSSQEGLEIDRISNVYSRCLLPRAKQSSKDSEDSSGIHEDSETEAMPAEVSLASVSEPPPPPLPPRQRQPQIIVIPANISSVPVDHQNDQSPTDDFCDKPRLDRRRNRPLRKLSLKRSKSSKQSIPASEEKVEHVKVGKSPSFAEISKSKLIRESISAPLPPSPIKTSDPYFDQQSSQKGAFQKAKKTFRTLIIGSNYKNDKKLKEQPLITEFDDASNDDNNSLLSSSHLNTDQSKNAASPHMLPISSNYTLLTPHNLKNVPSFQKSDICAACMNSMSLINGGLVCTNCNLLFHSSCLSEVSQVPCIESKTLNPSSTVFTTTNPSRPPRNKGRNKNKNFNSTLTSQKSEASSQKSCSNQSHQTSSNFSSWNVTRTAEFTDSKDILITDVTELHYMEVFINNKISQMEEAKRNSGKKSMVDIVFCIALKEFKSNLISTYSVASHDVCEVCSSLMWLMDKMWVCSNCKLTCHKKCTAKVTVTCKDNSLVQQGKKLFGSPLERLITEESNIPIVVEKLITAIELKGLYTEGIYRKSGTTSKINELKAKLEESVDDTDLDAYSVHVLSAVLKSFFRDMPEPLMTYELYDDFLWSTAISEMRDRVQAIYSHIAKLPRANYDVLERLIFHLARVAQQEHANRMNANSLAIVFAPCILRTNKPMQMQDKLSDISKQTICIELIINERLRQVRDTLADIDILDSACHTASSRLSSLRLSKFHLNRENNAQNVNRISQETEEDEEVLLTQQIEHLRNEKAHLTIMLPSFRLASTGSDEDLLSAVTEMESSMTASFDEMNLPSSPNSLTHVGTLEGIDLPALNPRSQHLRHLTKNRVSAPQNRRLPSKFCKQNKSPTAIRSAKSPLRRSKELLSKEVKREVSVFSGDEKTVRI